MSLRTSRRAQEADLVNNAEVAAAALHECHGWIDPSGKRHPCRKHAKTADYRCADCWGMLRACRGLPVEIEAINGDD